jgi:hypothetical protein
MSGPGRKRRRPPRRILRSSGLRESTFGPRFSSRPLVGGHASACLRTSKAPPALRPPSPQAGRRSPFELSAHRTGGRILRVSIRRVNEPQRKVLPKAVATQGTKFGTARKMQKGACRNARRKPRDDEVLRTFVGASQQACTQRRDNELNELQAPQSTKRWPTSRSGGP